MKPFNTNGSKQMAVADGQVQLLIGCNTRRYHGLLTLLPLFHQQKGCHLVSKLDETHCYSMDQQFELGYQ